MSEKISPDQLGNAISGQLTMYHESVIKELDKATKKSANELLRITKDTAPFDAKHHGRHYVDCIAVQKNSSRTGACSYTWYVKPPCYRLTHLLVNGHLTLKGGHTKKDPFLKDACDKVFSEYETEVENILQNG